MPRTVLVVGASGATGMPLTKLLLEGGHNVRIVVRDKQKLPADIMQHERLSVTEAALLDLSDTALSRLVDGCDSITSCLGHNGTPKGVWGEPRSLCVDAVRRLTSAVKTNRAASKTKFVLMNTVMCQNLDPDLQEQRNYASQGLVWLLRNAIPPHHDNEQAAEYLRTTVGKTDAHVEWVVVRPDALTGDPEVSPYKVTPMPPASPLFYNAGKTSRVNVADFMARLATDDSAFARWAGQMPVIFNEEPAAPLQRAWYSLW